MNLHPHQFIDRGSGRVVTERLVADRIIAALYTGVREKNPWLFNALTSSRGSRLLGYLNYDIQLPGGRRRITRLMQRMGISAHECLDDPAGFKTARELFERRIPYWHCRPMPTDTGAVVSPADAKMLAGNLKEHPQIRIKEKFFCLEELLGRDKQQWLAAFADGPFAIFRLTPDKYHHNHVPVDGRVADIYDIAGRYHSCNPGAAVQLASPLSKNRRVVTVLDTDVAGGTGVGFVAMIEIVALMIGDVVQCYSASRYDAPEPVRAGMVLKKGQPKSLFRPGSSSLVLIFEKDRIRFDADIIENLRRGHAASRYALAFSHPLVETDVAVRTRIAVRRKPS
ncbi:MAG: phosphatidylserine decarboxylase [Pseudomonadota bacterium]